MQYCFIYVNTVIDMKIAVVGKWWSGKSSISWLMTKYLLDHGHKVLAIDTDHNMDFSDVLWHEYTDKTPTFKGYYDAIFHSLGESEESKAREVITKYLGQQKFFLDKMDAFSTQVLIDAWKNLTLWIVWLWAEDVISGGRCAHGLSNPLKIYLTLLDEWGRDVIVDGVAWVDMINFGLYHACDYLIVVIEPSRNSIKVATQIKKLCDLTHVNYWFVVNKYISNEYSEQIHDQFWDKILGNIAIDQGLCSYDYASVTNSVKESIADVYEKARDHVWFSLIERVTKLEMLKW